MIPTVASASGRWSRQDPKGTIMNERSWMSDVAKRSRGRFKAPLMLLAVGLLTMVLPGCATSQAPTRGQRMMLEPAWNAAAAGDYATALRVYQRAADGGVPIAQYQLGRMYEKGTGTAQSDAEAARWYQAAAASGYLQAQSALAKLYEMGRGVAKNEAKALELYRAVAEYERSAEYRLKRQRYPGVALAKVGEMIERGRGTEADPFQAAQYYQWAGEAGNPDAQYRLAELYRRGKGVPRDEAVADKLYLAAAETYEARAAAGDTGAQSRLGELYLYGRGVSKDPKRAVAWLAPAAESGDASAQDRLGQLYEEGAGEIAANPPLAVYYYAQASARGHTGAKERLAALYASGKAKPGDAARVLEAFAEQAWHGDARAAYKIAEAFDRGLGVKSEPLEALTWYQIAQSLGDDSAADDAARLAERLGPAQTKDAMTTADAWRRESGAAEARPASFASGS
jgi:uncharacterized protein